MNKLTQEQQQLILDFYFHCGDQVDIEAGRDLIAASPAAAGLYAGLEDALTDLDHIKYESCPDNLVDLTIARLKLLASSSKASNARLHHLLEQEQKTTVFSTSESAGKHSIPANSIGKAHFLRPLFEVLAAAAMLALIAGILFPSFEFARAKYQQVACRNNMRVLGAGFASFAKDNDHNNNGFSEVKVKAGSPWWRIGDQGRQSRSNTRYPFMLIKGGYVDGRAFVCKGNKKAKLFNSQTAAIAQLYDFPSHKNISYSFTLFCDKNADPLLCSRSVIASDLNPVFQKIRCDRSVFQKMDEFSKLELNTQLKQSLSANHRGRGQNLLYGDGSVKCVQSRIINGDDIFTVSGVDVYTGREIPASSNDIFLAP
ncbi:MAG: hypothetical protein B6I25_02205 [Planctomycetales bacterium 4572_13]|nr:MAG: hypothetical protein B6I25_02205 [Planctomycetales bacterium 4572_13]